MQRHKGLGKHRVGQHGGSTSGNHTALTPAKQQRTSTGQDERHKQEMMCMLKKAVRRMYPNFDRRTYLKPPVRFNRVTHRTQPLSGVEVKVIEPAGQLSDVREDECQQRVHSLLAAMLGGLGEAMVVLFELDFDNYLNNPDNLRYDQAARERQSPMTCNAGPTERHASLECNGQDSRHSQAGPRTETTAPDLSVFTRPRDLPSDLQRGRLDILILHRELGVIVLKVKAIGDAFSLSEGLQSGGAQHAAIRRRLQRSLAQLDKEDAVIRHLTSDLTSARRLPVTKALVLPNVERQTVHAALIQDDTLTQRMCECLATPTLSAALDLCIFRDNLPPIGHSVNLSNQLISKLHSDWWTNVKEKALTHPPRVDDDELHDLYESMVARFCGPATTQYVSTAQGGRTDVVTLQQAVLHTARCFSQPVLSTQQVEVLGVQWPLVYLTGPPATGKTLLLELQARRWARQGKPVFVLSLWQGSEAVSRLIVCKVSEDHPGVQLLVGKDPRLTDVVQKLTSHGGIRGDKLCLVVDEAPWFLPDFVRSLQRALGGESFQMWAASSFPEWRPPSFREVVLTHPRRCPPLVVMEMQKTHAYRAFSRHSYTSVDAGVLAGMPAPTDGPPVKRVRHQQHDEGGGAREEGGGASEVWDCRQCGLEVAAFLTQDLQLARDPASNTHQSDGLTFSDVIISGHLPDNVCLSDLSPDLTDADKNSGDNAACHGRHDDGRVNSGFLRGLQEGGVPVEVVTRTAGAAHTLATPPHTHRVQLAQPHCILGLERPVVVVIGTTNVRRTYPRYVDPWFDVMAVCTSQLVLVGEVEADVEEMFESMTL